MVTLKTAAVLLLRNGLARLGDDDDILIEAATAAATLQDSILNRNHRMA